MMKELKEISKQNPFMVPENYFQEIKRKILAETAGIESGVTRKSITMRLRPYITIAASIAVLVISSYIAFHFFTRPDSPKVLPAISSGEFSDGYLNDIDILTLEEKVSTTRIFRDQTGFNNNDLIDYLVLENIDIYDIYEQL